MELTRRLKPNIVRGYVKYLCAFQTKTGDLEFNTRSFTSGAKEKSCKLLVIGGGTGGCSVAAKFANKLGKNNIIIVEPSDVSVIKTSRLFKLNIIYTLCFRFIIINRCSL